MALYQRKRRIQIKDKYGWWTIIKPITIRNNRVYARCVCGTERYVYISSLHCGGSKSCGCKQIELMSESKKTHGLSRTHLYQVWADMKSRCYKKDRRSYKNYGARGISVCEKWLNDPNEFYEWGINSDYKEGLTIDRIDNDGDYCPENCRWATPRQNCLNRTTSRFITYNGRTQNVSLWAKECGLKSGTLEHRLNRGWKIEHALKCPVRSGGRRPEWLYE